MKIIKWIPLSTPSRTKKKKTPIKMFNYRTFSIRLSQALCYHHSIVLNKLTWKPPCGSWLQPVVNCNNRAISVCEKLLTAAQNQSNTRRNSWFDPLTIWCALKSAIEYSPVPHNKSLFTEWILFSDWSRE